MKRLILAFGFMLVGCGSEPSLPTGEVFEDVFGETSITVRRNGKLDITQNSSTVPGTYKFDEEGRVRITANSRMSQVVRIFKVTDNGLEELNGKGDPTTILYRANMLEEGRCQHLAQGFRPMAEELLQRIEGDKLTEYERLLQGWDKPRFNPQLQRSLRDFNREQLGMKGHYALKVTRKGCPKVLIWDSKKDPDIELLSQEKAQKRWGKLRQSLAG